MPTRNIMDRINEGDVLLMDGGTGSEIQARGAEVLIGATVGSGLKAWSATANIEYADVVQQVHQDYLRVGADILISNNFWASPSRLEHIGLKDSWKDYARAGGENAIKARDTMKPEAYVSGGIAPPTFHGGAGIAPPISEDRGETQRPDVDIMGRDAYFDEFAEHAQLLADVGVDFMLPEYVGFVDDCVVAVDACAEAGLPVFLGVRHLQSNGLLQYGETVEDLAQALEGHPVDGILLMCSGPESISTALPRLVDAFNGPVGAYPNIGFNPFRLLDEPDNRDRPMEIATYPPAQMADFGSEWKEMGAQIIGGCCGAGPEHILMLNRALRG